MSAATTGLTSSRVSKVFPGRSQDGVRQNEHVLHVRLRRRAGRCPRCGRAASDPRGIGPLRGLGGSRLQRNVRRCEHPRRSWDGPATNRGGDHACPGRSRVAQGSARNGATHARAADRRMRVCSGLASITARPGGRARLKRGTVSRDGPDADREGELGTESCSVQDHEGQLQGR